MVIAFYGNDYLNANGWYLRRLYRDVVQRNELDEEFKFDLFMATDSFKCIAFDSMKPDRRRKLMKMLKELSIEVVNDSDNIHRNEMSVEYYQIYKQALQELLGRIEKYEDFGWPENNGE